MLFELAGCAKRPVAPPPLPPAPVYGYDWQPFRASQIELAAFAGGAATNRQGLYHVLTRRTEEPRLLASAKRCETNPCCILRKKLDALERCAETGTSACTFPLE